MAALSGLVCCGSLTHKDALRAVVEPVEMVFKIKGGYTIDTIPMERLAEYMGDFARLLGEPDKVHFVGVIESSVGVVAKIQPDSYPVIEERLDQIQRGTAPIAYMDAYRALNKRLKDDGHHAELVPPDKSAVVLQFPGALAPIETLIEGVSQAGSLDGVVIRVGGKTKEKAVFLQAGNAIYRCTATKAVAKELAHHIFEDELRVHGQGKWARDEDGVWSLKKFSITYFEELDNRPLSEAVAALRAMHEANPSASQDPWSDLIDIRNDD